MTTRTQGHNYSRDAEGTGGYINDDGDTWNVLLAITINKAKGQSLEKCGIDLNTDCFPMDNYYFACSRVGKRDNLGGAESPPPARWGEVGANRPNS